MSDIRGILVDYSQLDPADHEYDSLRSRFCITKSLERFGIQRYEYEL